MFGKFMIIFAGKRPVGSDTRTYKWGSSSTLSCQYRWCIAAQTLQRVFLFGQ
ncbi:hypothetical protein C0J52_19848 [Blattella germanica]|nr:hypothetical protein C0J52_19848 [Blattella germanica]